jgi:hypothetical protein
MTFFPCLAFFHLTPAFPVAPATCPTAGGCFSLPRKCRLISLVLFTWRVICLVPAAMSQSHALDISILSASDSCQVPDGYTRLKKPLTFRVDGALACHFGNLPAVTRAELCRLGHVEDARKPECQRRSRSRKENSFHRRMFNADLR